MLRKLRPRSAYDVMAAIAFFIAVAGGSAYAATTIGASNIKNDAVRSRHIKDGAVKSPDLAANSVGTGKVTDGSLLAQDFNAGDLPKGHDGAPGTARAYAVTDGRTCPVGHFCPLLKTKDVAYVFQIGQGHYCVGVNGISADAADSVAVVTAVYPGSLTTAWIRHPNSGCVDREFEVYTELSDHVEVRNATDDGKVAAQGPPYLNSLEFTIAIL
jgi:hypothetical protein